jgi:DNA-binding SARP family transcriptional activator/tetratricopeptide (TPR) repeat protein
MAVWFRLLGSVGADRDGQPLDLGHARQQCVLAVLLVEANAVVPADQLIERVWGPRPSPSARNTLHTYVARLRRVLATAPEAVIERGPGGYRLTVDEQLVDVHRFRHLVTRARSAGETQALALLDEALGLWRGEPFTGLDSPWLAEVRTALDTQRTAAELDRTDHALRHGRHTELITELTGRVEEHPLDERLTGQLMLALYRSGRQADALTAYHRARRTLADQLGIDPGPALAELHQRILTGDPTLTAGKPAASPAVVPRQLPADVTGFSGRVQALARLDAHVADTSAVVVLVSGTGGVGKTALAVHWAHKVAHRYPDGQLHVDLRGYDEGNPADPMDVLVRFLQALGVDGGEIPVDPDARSARLRSALAGKRVLLLLDNARTADQVRPLLPGAAGCLTLVTSRDALTGLVVADGARRVELDLFDPAESRDLLRTLLGARVDAEPDAVDRLVEQCTGLPLALRLTADLAERRHRTPLSRLAADLTGEQDLLDRLDAGTDQRTALRAVFSWSYRSLTDQGARLFRLMGLAPGADIDAHGCAALLGTSVGEALRTLDELVRAHLVEERTADRFQSHDLLRAYARTRAEADEPEAERDKAVRRLVDYLLHTAYGAERFMDRHHAPVAIPLAPAAPGVPERTFPDTATALAWFSTEYENLLAAQAYARAQGRHAEVVQFAAAMRTALFRHRLRQAYANTQLAAAEAAEALGHVVAEAVCRGVLAQAYALLADYDAALRHGEHGLRLAEKTGDPLVQALAHRAIAWADHHRGAYQEALDHCARALDLARATGAVTLEADLLNGMGWIHTMLGDHRRALPLCEESVALSARAGYRESEAPALHSLGYVHLRLGNHDAAKTAFLTAAEQYEELGLRSGIVEAYLHLGDAHAESGDTDAAVAAWQRALDALDDKTTPRAATIEARIATRVVPRV